MTKETKEVSTIPALAMPEAELLSVLESSVYPGAQLGSIKMVIGYCKAQHLDPLQKPVHIVPMSVKKGDNWVMRDVVMPGIGLYRVQAARTGLYAGIDAAEFGPDITTKLDGKDFIHPEWCSVIAYRIAGGVRCPFSSGKVYWLETYSSIKRDKQWPNAMWAKRTRGQIEKCAEALALRRAFPELGSAPTAEELEGKVLDASDEQPTKAVNPFMPGAAPAEPAAETPQVLDVNTETGEITQPAGGAVAKPEASTSAPPAASNGPTASAGMIKTVRNKMSRTGKTDEQLTAEFGFTVDAMPMAKVNDVITWASK